MNVCISNNNTKKSKVLNALSASDELGVNPKELYDMYHKGIVEYRHFSIVWDVEIIKKKPSGKPFPKGQSGYLNYLVGKAK